MTVCNLGGRQEDILLVHKDITKINICFSKKFGFLFQTCVSISFYTCILQVVSPTRVGYMQVPLPKTSPRPCLWALPSPALSEATFSKWAERKQQEWSAVLLEKWQPQLFLEKNISSYTLCGLCAREINVLSEAGGSSPSAEAFSCSTCPPEAGPWQKHTPSATGPPVLPGCTAVTWVLPASRITTSEDKWHLQLDISITPSQKSFDSMAANMSRSHASLLIALMGLQYIALYKMNYYCCSIIAYAVSQKTIYIVITRSFSQEIKRQKNSQAPSPAGSHRSFITGYSSFHTFPRKLLSFSY